MSFVKTKRVSVEIIDPYSSPPAGMRKIQHTSAHIIAIKKAPDICTDAIIYLSL